MIYNTNYSSAEVLIASAIARWYDKAISSLKEVASLLLAMTRVCHFERVEKQHQTEDQLFF